MTKSSTDPTFFAYFTRPHWIWTAFISGALFASLYGGFFVVDRLTGNRSKITSWAAGKAWKLKPPAWMK